MQLSQMISLCSQRLNEAAAPMFYPASEITAALNEADRTFVLLTLGLETTKPWSLPSYAANGSSPFFHMLATFSDWIAPLRISTAPGVKVRPARIEDLTSLDSGWINSPGSPVRYAAVGADLVALYQQPAAAGTTLFVTYARGPAGMVNPADTPEVPAEYHPCYVDYAIYRLRQVEGAQVFESVLPLFGSFLEAVQQYAGYVRARNRGSQYDTVPFEIESFDRSTLLQVRRDLVPLRKDPNN